MGEPLSSLDGCIAFVTEDGEGPEPSESLEKAVGRATKSSKQAQTVVVWANSSGAAGDILVFDANRRLERPVLLGVEHFGIRILEGATLSFDEQQQTLIIAGSMTLRLAALSPAVAQSEVPIPDSTVRIRCAHDVAGTVEFDVPGSSPLDASVRYFYGPTSALRRLVYPVFPAAITQALRIQVNPGSNLRRVAPLATNGTPVRYPSCFRTPLGLEIELGTTDNSAFVLEYDPVTAEYYPVLDGEWTTNLSGPTAPPPRIDLMLGTSGLEYAKVAPGSKVEWRAGGPA